MARILIVGCGYLGSAIGVRLAGMGHVVFGLRRNPEKLPLNVNRVEGDVTVPNTLRRIPDVDTLLYLLRPDRDDADSVNSTLAIGPRHVLGAFAAKRIELKRIFFGSSVRVYGDRGGEWVDEDSELGTPDVVGAALRTGESVVEEAKARVTVLRFGELYGPKRPGLMAKLRPGAGPLDAPTAHANLIHRHDAVEATIHLLGRKHDEKRYVIVDREPAPRLEVLGWLAERARCPLPAVAGDGAKDGNVRAMSERLSETGFRFRFPSYREGYRNV